MNILPIEEWPAAIWNVFIEALTGETISSGIFRAGVIMFVLLVVLGLMESFVPKRETSLTPPRR